MGMTLGIVSAAASLTTGIMQGVQSYQQNKAMQQSAEDLAEQERGNARRAEEASRQRAIAIEQRANARERMQRAQNKALLAQNRARIGAGGLDYSGTPLLVEIDNAMNMEMDLQNARIDAQNEMQEERYRGHLLSVSHENKARSYDFQADQYGSAKKWGVANSIIGTAGSVIGSLGGSYSAYQAGGGKDGNSVWGVFKNEWSSLL